MSAQAVACNGMRVLICGWVGSTNLGDELVLAGVRRLLGPQVRSVAVSIDPTATSTSHGIGAVDHRALGRIARLARSADLVVLGGGGLIQDETSPANLPYHLSRAWLAQLAGTPVVGLALGVGRLSTPLGRQLATTLTSLDAVSVRDAPSQALLAELGVPSVLAADAAIHLTEPRPALEGEPLGATAAPVGSAGDRLVVSLRPWRGSGGLLPVSWRASRGSAPDWLVPLLADRLDRAVRTTGLPVRFVALQTDRDDQVHRAVAARMATRPEVVVPDRHSVLTEIARGRVVVAMRYHAGIAATLAGRPSALIGYSPKVDALADTLGDGARLLWHTPESLEALDRVIGELVSDPRAPDAVDGGRAVLMARSAGNRQVLALVGLPV